MQCVPSISYVPNNSLLPVAQTEVGIGPYIPHSSVPVKVLPYNHLTAGGEIGTHPEPVRTFHSILLFPDRVLPAELQVGDMVWSYKKKTGALKTRPYKPIKFCFS